MFAQRVFSLFLLLCFGGLASAQTYYRADVKRLTFEDDIDAVELIGETGYANGGRVFADIILEGESYAFVDGTDIYITHRADDPKAPLKGHLVTPQTYQGENQTYPFVVDPATIGVFLRDDGEEFRKALAKVSAQRLKEGYPGALIHGALASPDEADENNRRGRRGDSISHSLDFLVGSRALTENLALDRMLELAPEGDVTVATHGIKGITTPAVDWDPLMAGVDLPAVAADAIPRLIPHDQHVLIAPSIAGLFDLIDAAESKMLPAVTADHIDEEAGQIIARYMRQMGLELPRELITRFPVESVCITGSDPFFRMGTDVALVIDVAQPATVLKTLRLLLGQKFGDEVTVTDAEFTGTAYQSSRSTDGSISCASAIVGDSIVIANSVHQIERIISVHSGKLESLAALDEYLYFRSQLPRTDDELVYVFLSDDTIRRWCSPAVRIGSSRKITALAALKRLRTQSLLGLEQSQKLIDYLGGIQTSADGRITSKVYGAMSHLKPLSALDLTTVSEKEAEAYTQWKEGYESGWRVFDPIAFRLQKDRESGEIISDLSVLPLTANSDYRDMIEFAGSAKLLQSATLAHDGQMGAFAISFDTQKEEFKEAEAWLGNELEELPFPALAWMQGDVSVTLDDNALLRSLPYWPGGEPSSAMLSELNVVLRIPSKDHSQLQQFSAALIEFLLGLEDESFKTEKFERNNIKVIELSFNGDEDGKFSAFIAPTPSALLISLTREGMEAAIDREPVLAAEAEVTPDNSVTLLDSQLFARIRGRLLGDAAVAMQRSKSSTQDRLQNNESLHLASTLNLLRHLAPDKDAERFFHQITDTTAAGVAYEPKVGGYLASKEPREKTTHALAGIAALFDTASASLRFENEGLQVRLRITPPMPKPEPEPAPVFDPAAREWFGITPGLERTLENHFIFGDEIVEFTVTDTLESHDEKGAVHTLHSVDDEGVELRGSQTFSFESGISMTHFALGDYRQIISRPSQYFPPSLKVGSTFSDYTTAYMGDEVLNPEDNTYYEYSLTVLGHEDMTTQAGTFKNCLKIRSEWKGSSPLGFENRSTTTWFAKGIGAIRVDYRNGSSIELIDYRIVPEDDQD